MNWRLIKAFALAPGAPCVLAGLVAAILNDGLASFPVVFLLYAVVAYPLALITGVPAYLVLSRIGPLRRVPTILVGTALGAACGLVITLAGRQLAPAVFAKQVGLCALYGAVTAFVFWHLALRPQVQPESG
jgi:hypothetical protein